MVLSETAEVLLGSVAFVLSADVELCEALDDVVLSEKVDEVVLMVVVVVFPVLSI